MKRDGDVRVHTHGTERCSACGGKPCKCPSCGERTLHRVAFSDYVCENGCSPRKRLEETWKAEMRAAVAKVA